MHDFRPSRHRPDDSLLSNLLGLLALALMLFAFAACSGCRYVKVERADGTTLSYLNVGFDTTVDELSVPTPSGPATMKGASSDSKLAAAAADLSAAARSIAGAPPAPQRPRVVVVPSDPVVVEPLPE